MARKTNEERVARLEAGSARRSARAGDAMWPNALARVTVATFARSETVSRDELIRALEIWAENRHELLKAGSTEAIARLREAFAKGESHVDEGD